MCVVDTCLYSAVEHEYAETCCAHPNHHLGENRKTLPTAAAAAAAV